MGLPATNYMVKLLKRLLKWLTKEEYVPDVPPVSRPAYLAAWKTVLGSEEGRVLLAYLRFSLWQVASEIKPFSADTAEKAALWLAGRDARLGIMLDLVRDATENMEQIPKPRKKWDAPKNQ